MKKLLAGIALASLALASVSPADAQVSLNLNAPTVDGANSGTINSATLNAAYTLPLNGGQNTVAFSLSGLGASGGTVVVEATVDGTNWFGLNSAQGGSGALQQSFTADGTFLVNVASRSAVRIRESVVGSGTITVSSITSIAQRDMGIDKPLPAGGNAIGTTPSSVFYVGATGTASALAASATFTGAARDTGVAAGSLHPFAYFNAVALADQAGTLFLDGSNDGTTWVQTTSAAAGALSANVPLILSVPVLFKFYRARVVNGATAETTLTLNSGFTGG